MPAAPRHLRKTLALAVGIALWVIASSAWALAPFCDRRGASGEAKHPSFDTLLISEFAVVPATTTVFVVRSDGALPRFSSTLAPLTDPRGASTMAPVPRLDLRLDEAAPTDISRPHGARGQASPERHQGRGDPSPAPGCPWFAEARHDREAQGGPQLPMAGASTEMTLALQGLLWPWLRGAPQRLFDDETTTRGFRFGYSQRVERPPRRNGPWVPVRRSNFLNPMFRT